MIDKKFKKQLKGNSCSGFKKIGRKINKGYQKQKSLYESSRAIPTFGQKALSKAEKIGKNFQKLKKSPKFKKIKRKANTLGSNIDYYFSH